jgi:hypothetical protein
MFYLLVFSNKKKIRKEREKRPEDIFPGQTHYSGCAKWGFPPLLVATKSCSKCQSLNFICILSIGGYLVG